MSGWFSKIDDCFIVQSTEAAIHIKGTGTAGNYAGVRRPERLSRASVWGRRGRRRGGVARDACGEEEAYERKDLPGPATTTSISIDRQGYPGMPFPSVLHHNRCCTCSEDLEHGGMAVL
jgi:hypothetical protein